ncbi:MAG: hypothetical protein FJ088_12910, partial [Deltaproteobacteria bacterium]|nr:hypothetical protein [Deltaproteobacteria bacterium]
MNIARLSIYPVIFFPKKGEAAVYTHLKIKITLKRKSGGATAKRMPDVFLSVLKKSLLNSWQLRDQAIHEPERILVVAHDSFKGAIQPYIDWKNGIGLKTKLALTSKIGSTKDKLQQFILSEYNSDERPAFILFVGDAEHIPPKWGSDGCASDYMYSQLEGNDLYSDVIIGRFSGKTEEEIKLQVEKVIFYEANPLYGGDGLWLPFGTCISSSEGSGQSNDDYRSDIICGKMEDYGYATDKFYHSKGNDTAYNISTALDEGRGYLCYLGHGSGTSWATTNPPYSNEHVNALENAFKLPIIMDVSCSNGQFAEPSDCLAEAWMKAGTPGFPEGGMGIYSSSTLTAWDEPAEMAIGMIEGLIEAGFHRWGEAALYSRQHVIGKFGAGSNVELVFQQYVLFGDPSLMFRTVPPNELKVAAPAVVPVGNFEFQVDVSDGAAGVGDALVSLKKGDEFALTAYTDETGKAVFQ